MYFSTLPDMYAPIGAPLRYTLAACTAEVVDLYIRTTDGRLLGTKRFVDPTEICCDIAPYLRHLSQLKPRASQTGFVETPDLVLEVYLEAVSEEESLQSEVRTFLPTSDTVTAPKLLTSLPVERLLAPSECDYLALLTTDLLQVVVTCRYRNGEEELRTYTANESGLHLFCLAADDFPEAEQLTIDAVGCGTIRYSLLEQPEGAVRLAWRSRKGSLEHYTFPLIERVEIATKRRRSYNSEGARAHVEAFEERLTLHSAYECEAMMRALGDLVTAEELWVASPTAYHPVELLTETAEIHRHGTLHMLKAEIRSTLKNDLLWS